MALKANKYLENGEVVKPFPVVDKLLAKEALRRWCLGVEETPIHENVP